MISATCPVATGPNIQAIVMGDISSCSSSQAAASRGSTEETVILDSYSGNEDSPAVRLFDPSPNHESFTRVQIVTESGDEEERRPPRLPRMLGANMACRVRRYRSGGGKGQRLGQLTVLRWKWRRQTHSNRQCHSPCQTCIRTRGLSRSLSPTASSEPLHAASRATLKL